MFPFVHGLSYTGFAYENLTPDRTALAQHEALRLSFTLRNTGTVTGKEIAQVYVAPRNMPHRPVRELKRFIKVSLEPGEAKTVSVQLDARAFSRYREDEGWRTDGGVYDILPSSI